MLKALLKKQLMEFFSGIFIRNNNGKEKKSVSKAGFAVLMLIVVLSFLFMFSTMAYMLTPLIEDGYKWVYFSIFGTLATLLGVFGSVFLTYNTLYEAKDNDLLLSMPIPTQMILFSRMTGLYLSALFFESLVLVPAVGVSAFVGSFGIVSFIISLVNIFVMPFLALIISCVFGWILAVFSSRLRNKSLISVFFSIVFFAVYYFAAMRLNTIINEIIYNAENVGEWIKKFLYPLYKMGSGCAGDIFSYAVFLSVCAVCFVLVYKVLSVGFVRISTTKRGMKKTEYKEKTVKMKSVKLAFLKKEFLYLKNTPVYMLNCALGSVILLIFAVVLIVKGRDMLGMISAAEMPDGFITVALCMSCCFIASTNNLTSPAISLEAKNLWLLKSVPADIKDIFFGKIMMHIIVTGVPLAVLSLVASVVLKNSFLLSVLSLIFCELFMTVCAMAGLAFNIIFPKTDWTNEAVPIKQSLASMLGMFFGMILTMISIAGYFVFSAVLSPDIYIAVISAVFCLIIFVIAKWLMTKGEKKFSEL